MSINYPHPIPTRKPPVVNMGLVISVGSQVGLALTGIILLALLIGLGIDALLGATQHPFTILLFLGSVPFSLFLTFWLAKRATKELNSQQPAATQSTSVEEEGKRE